MNARSGGFTLVSVIFLLVVVAGLGAFMVTIGTTQRETSTLSVLSGRAFAAAASGMEWAVHDVVTNDACFASPATFNLSGGAADGYSVTATCASTAHMEGTNTYNVFRLSVTASRGSPGSAGYVSRTLRASVTSAP